MLVRRIGLGLIITFSLSLIACSDKNLDDVFPQGKTDPKPAPPPVPDDCDGSRLIQNRFIVTWENGRTTVEHSENSELFKQKFLKPRLHSIKYVEFDQEIRLRDVQTSSVEAAASLRNWGQEITEAQSVWDQGIYGQGIKVGVVDAAVDYRHSQIAPRLAANSSESNGITARDDDGNGFVDDLYGWDFYQNTPDPVNLVGFENSHGTHVSGIILGDHTTGSLKGLAPQATLVPANFMSANGSGSLGAGIAAIKYVASRGVRVINASWGGPACSQTLKNTIGSLANSGILFVVAAGNDGLDLDVSPDYPANYNLANQITIGATNINDYLTTWSNSSYNFVHLGAPGDSIFSSVSGGYAYMSGTSMAAPFVTGAAALLWSVKPNATFTQIKQALLSGVDSRNLRVSARGRLNLRKSVDEIRRIVP